MALKVLHIPFTYMPDPHGGTEIYVAALCHYLSELGVQNEVAAPGSEASSYVHGQVPVHRFATHPALTQDMMFGGGDPIAADGFAKILDRVKPDLIHFHSFTPAVGVRCLAEVQKRGLPAMVTYHTPTTSCVRGTLLRWGTTVCDGEMQTLRCSACFLHSHGMPQPLAWSAAAMSGFTWPISRLPELSNASRAVLGATHLMDRRLQATRDWWDGMQKIVVLCEWSQDVLLRNGVPAEKLRKVRHGLPTQKAEQYAATALPVTPLKLAFLGRLDATKGIDLLIHALQQRPDLPMELDIYAMAPANDDVSAQHLLQEVSRDPRIRLRTPVASTEVVHTLRGYHALAVPSRWLETGPLVVLEALAAGIPVLGSNLGGIAEWITHQENGLLVDAPTPMAWACAIARLVDEPHLLEQLRNGVKPPRSMRDVATETQAIYAEIVS